MVCEDRCLQVASGRKVAPQTCFGLMTSTGLLAVEQLQRTLPPPPPPTQAQPSPAGATALPYESPLLAFKSYRC